MSESRPLFEHFQEELYGLLRWAKRLIWLNVCAGIASGLGALVFLVLEERDTLSFREVVAKYGDLIAFLGLSGGLILSVFAAVMWRILGQLERLELAMTNLGCTDPLTHAYNRYRMIEDLERLHAESRRHDAPYSVLMIDIDNFKRINDRLVHAAGDAILQQLADRIRSQVRKDGALYRYGGEEFVILVPRAAIESGHQMAERLRILIEAAPFHWLNEQFNITVSIGIGAYDGSSPLPAARVLATADNALASAKANGRNRVNGQTCVVTQAV